MSIEMSVDMNIDISIEANKDSLYLLHYDLMNNIRIEDRTLVIYFYSDRIEYFSILDGFNHIIYKDKIIHFSYKEEKVNDYR